MTLDEAIKERQKVIEVQEKLYEDASTNEAKEIIKSAIDNDRQLAERLTELKEAKRLLKAAINDFELPKDCRICNPKKAWNCIPDKSQCLPDGSFKEFEWRHKAEALKLLKKG